MGAKRKDLLQPIAWLMVGLGGVAAWVLLLQQAVAETGASGYFLQLAQTSEYFLAWPCLLFGLQALVASNKRWLGLKVLEASAGVYLGLLPEILLSIPVVARFEAGGGQWFFWLERAVHYLQRPGRLLTTPFGVFDRWAVGLFDPGSDWVAKEIMVLNLANVAGWVAACLLLGAYVRQRAAQTRT